MIFRKNTNCVLTNSYRKILWYLFTRALYDTIPTQNAIIEPWTSASFLLIFDTLTHIYLILLPHITDIIKWLALLGFEYFMGECMGLVAFMSQWHRSINLMIERHGQVDFISEWYELVASSVHDMDWWISWVNLRGIHVWMT